MLYNIKWLDLEQFPKGGFMDKIQVLQTRRAEVLAAGKSVRKDISELVDADSFVELSGFSFSKNEFYGEDAAGEGVVCGFATIDGYPVYIAAQNFDVLNGGVSRENCAKILRCIALAEKNSTPVVYLLSSHGVQIGEGVAVLDGLASLLSKSAKLHGVVPQFAVVNGEVYGQAALLTANADFTYFMDNSVLAADSPLVISAASGKNLPKNEVGGTSALKNTGLVSFVCKKMADIRASIGKILGIIPAFGGAITDNGEDLNKAFPALNKECQAGDLIEAVFDSGSYVETGSNTAPEVRCVLGRVGGISVGAVVFDSEDGVRLDAVNVAKITAFVEFVAYYNLPFITFVDTLGVRANLQTNDSLVLKNIFKLMETYDLLENAKISVVYKKAVGLGYTLFAAKSMGFDYNYAFADAKIALFDSEKGAEIEFAGEKKADKAKLAEKYAAEKADPINAARYGDIDNIIEPQYVKQYLIASLQMLLK